MNVNQTGWSQWEGRWSWKLVSALSLSRELFVFLHFMRLWSCFHTECRSLDLNHSYQKSGSRLERCFDADDDDVEESDLFQMKSGFAKRKLFFSKETSWLRKYFGIISDCFALHSLNLITSHISNDDQDDKGLDEPNKFFLCGIKPCINGKSQRCSWWWEPASILRYCPCRWGSRGGFSFPKYSSTLFVRVTWSPLSHFDIFWCLHLVEWCAFSTFATLTVAFETLISKEHLDERWQNLWWSFRDT